MRPADSPPSCKQSAGPS